MTRPRSFASSHASRAHRARSAGPGSAGARSARLVGAWLCAAVGVSSWVGSARADSYDETTPEQEPDELPGQKTEPGSTQEGPLTSGGLEAPGALPEKGDQRSQTERELEEADREDSKRGLEFAWLNGEIGFQTLNVPTGGVASGLVYGAGLGVRVLYFTLGARFRAASLDGNYDAFSLIGEGTMRLPFGHFEPYALVGLGYSQIRDLPSAPPNLDSIDLRLGVGADYYLSDTFSVGAQVAGDLLFVSLPVGSTGDNLGTGFTGTALVGLHF
ncbi:MAG TPA: hypothetical protein VLC09_12620 [Polyangiaceae bacterium]|nr:hypothetical protein [Polyangiaceae bacterium]